MSLVLPKPVTEYIEAANSFDGDRLLAAFSDNALVNDARREFWGREAIARWSSKEIIGDKVTLQVTETKEHYGTVIVDAVIDGEFDKTNLPDPLILTHYFSVVGDEIVSLVIILNSGPRER